jgi:starch synthase (maltosyl-transferring)
MAKQRTTSRTSSPPPPPAHSGALADRPRPSRAVVEPVRPVVDGGAFAAKTAIGEPMVVLADVFTDGHDVVAAALRWRQVSPGDQANDRADSWETAPMASDGNDRFRGVLTPSTLGRFEYEVVGWIDHLETWRRDTIMKLDAGLDVASELLAGARLVDAALAGRTLDADDRARLDGLRRQLLDGEPAATSTTLRDSTWADVFWRCSPRDPEAHLTRPLPVDVDPLHASFAAWYEFFPRSSVGVTGGDNSPRTLLDSIDRLDHAASMGFDIVYLPPVHPIGVTNRKGRNNATTATADDVGSPWAIGAAAGGHTAVAPELGTVEDVATFAAACAERSMHLALDIAFQCSPDHPWVTEHPEWFAKRPDGSIQYAENPPKKYEDIYPLDFESDDWQGLWNALADVFRFWIGHGVTVFRVDNPHTKAFAFWEWAIATLRAEHPEAVFLAESFTRPRVMERLAKIGFNQNYTYFAWRQSQWELQEYFTDLATRTVDYFRPNAWPNTPDILTEQLQHGGRAAFVSRAILAATLSPSWGVYGPAFELLEHRAVREGSEEYLDSEKYQLRTWDLDRDDSLAPLLSRLNKIRHEQRALRSLHTLRFHTCDDPGILCFSKTDPAGVGRPILVVVNLDPFERHQANVDIDLAALGLPYGADYDVVDELGGVTYRWSANMNFVDLAPWSASAHVFSVHRLEEPATDDDPGTTEAAR